MRTAPAKVSAMTLFVGDPARSKAFYGRLLDLEPIFEDADSVAFGFDNLIINLLRSSEAGDLIEPAPVGPPDAGARFQLTIPVKDADAAAAELAGLGVGVLNGPINRPWGVRTLAFADPDGHVWEFAQDLAPQSDSSTSR
jgi:catechol 2,3-dioxygenase-like lactoylglutathione lyase family enzyme